MIGGPGHREQQIGQTIDVAQQDAIYGWVERDHAPFGASAHRARDVKHGAALCAPRENEPPQGWRFAIEAIDEAFEARDIAVAERGLDDAVGDSVVWIGQLGTEREEVALDLHEGRGQFVMRGAEGCPDKSEPRVELVDVAVSRHARIALLHPGAIKE
nr:hypothetical protein Hi04_10k_c446_00023 [uncultured bacterium]